MSVFTSQAQWSAALDDFEHTLARAVAALEDPDIDQPATDFVPPAIAEPFPPELLSRANGLLTQAAGITGRIQVAQAGIRQDLARLPRTRPASLQGESRFEAHA